MKRLLIKKLIVISDSEKSSRELDFEKGLNIIIGENKTGKSSLIKSMFYTFGCQTKLESDWKKLISTYVVYFEHGTNEYCIMRQGSMYKIFQSQLRNERYILRFESDDFHEYSKYLMSIFDVSMDCLTKEAVQISATPPLLFRFQYIDQDNGWNKIAEGFSNLAYIKNWKPYSNKYVVGYQGEDYYKTKQKIDLTSNIIEKLKVKMTNYNELVETLKIALQSNKGDIKNNFPWKNDYIKSKDLLQELSKLEKEKIIIEEEISILKNEKYEKFLEMEALKRHIKNIDKDHKFAITQEDIIKCPFCGAEHKNTIEERIEFIIDIQTGNELIKVCRKDIKIIDEKIIQLENKRMQTSNKSNHYKKELESIKESDSIITTYKEEGKSEIINKSIDESGKIQLEFDEKGNYKIELERELKKLNSPARRKLIKQDLLKIYQEVITQVNIPQTYIKLTDFIQVLDKTGSEMPRIVLAFQVALYLYNLERGESPFNWLVIDTPNQQGQDGKNLKNIDSILEFLLTEKGQAIIGTERKTGFESKASKVIELTEYKRCLSKEGYLSHLSVINSLEGFHVL